MGVVAAVGCSKPEEEPKGKEGDSCAVDADCESDLACRDSVCVPKAVDPDMGGTGDGGNNGGDAGNNGSNNTPVEDEDFVVSYVLEDRDDNRTLWVYDSSNGEHTRVSPEGSDCRLGCWLSEDLSTFVTAVANGPNFDVLTSDVGADFALGGAPMPLVTNVRRIEVIGNLVTYVKEDAGQNKAYYTNLSGGGETLIGVIGEAVATEGDWFVDPAAQKAVVYNATLQTMDVKIADLGEEVGAAAFTIDSTNYQETSGSYFGGNIPTAFSPDGKYMALVTQKAPMDYGLCENASECIGVGERCGRFGRCSVIEVVVHFFDLASLDNLGEPCSADSACGPVHTCDIPAEDAVDQATCIPRRVVLGLPGQQMQNGQTGCALTAGNDDLVYTDVRAPISFGPGGNLYLTAARACGEGNIERTDIVKLSPTSSDIQIAYGNEGNPFDPDKCWSEAENRPDVTNCVAWIERAVVSPGGNALAFVATNPNVTDVSLAQTHVDLWTVLRNGENHDWVGAHPELEVVKTLSVHPKP